MRWLASLLVPLIAAFATPSAAQEIAYEPVAQELSYLDAPGFSDAPDEADWLDQQPTATQTTGYEDATTGERFVGAQAPRAPRDYYIAYGPFVVLDDRRAALVDVTDEHSPGAFAAMLRDYPGIAVLEMVECPGTEDDRANLQLGRMIHARGLVTYVPDGGSVRSGAVELFLAGSRRYADPGAEFAVHAWLDEAGREPWDYPSSAPENRKYIDYYREMGMTPVEAESFYAMTNSVPHARARWLSAREMNRWVRLD